MPSNNGGILNRLIERTGAHSAHFGNPARNTAQQAGSRPLIHGCVGNSQDAAHLFRCQQALLAQTAEPGLEVINPTDILDLLWRKQLVLPSPMSPLVQNFHYLTITVLV